MSDVPPDVIPNLLSRLPVESLLRFRCVSKSWLRMIDDPSFVKLHLCCQSETSYGHLIIKSDNKLYSLSTDSLYHYSQTSAITIEASPLESLTLNRVLVHQNTRGFTVSCNGLILIQYANEEIEWTLWNPFTREELPLPPYSYTSKQIWFSPYCGLGYDFISDDYKFVILWKSRGCWRKLVYSLKLNSWKKTIEDCPSSFTHPVPGVFVNGKLHWLTLFGVQEIKELAIFVFDLSTEEYNLLLVPVPVAVPSFTFTPSLCASGEYLLLTYSRDSVYRLDDYGSGKNLWTKLFSFSDIEWADINPISYLKNKAEVLLVDDRKEGHYFLFNIDKKSAKEIHLYDHYNVVPTLSCSQICMASLVRLNNYGSTTNRSNAAKESTSLKTNSVIDQNNTSKLQLTLTTTNVEKNTNHVLKVSYLDTSDSESEEDDYI